MTKRTNEQPTLDLELRSPAAKRLASLFLFHGTLGLKEIYHILDTAIIPPDFSRSALRGVIKRWAKRNILLTDGYRYILNPRGGREILLKASGYEDESVRERKALDRLTTPIEPRTETVVVDITPRWWKEILDIPKAWKENELVKCRIDEHISKAIWILCELKPKGQKDRSQKARHYHFSKNEHIFTLVVFPRGKMHIYTKTSPLWLDDLLHWLKDGGLSPSDLILVSRAVRNAFKDAIGTLEVPLKMSADPILKYRAEIKSAGREASVTLVRSHYEMGELEARGDLQFRLDWLAILTGATIESMGRSDDIEQLKNERTEIQTDLEELREMLLHFKAKFEEEKEHRLLELYEGLAKKLEEQDEKISRFEKEREKFEAERKKKKPDYFG